MLHAWTSLLHILTHAIAPARSRPNLPPARHQTRPVQVSACAQICAHALRIRLHACTVLEGPQKQASREFRGAPGISPMLRRKSITSGNHPLGKHVPAKTEAEAEAEACALACAHHGELNARTLSAGILADFVRQQLGRKGSRCAVHRFIHWQASE